MRETAQTRFDMIVALENGNQDEVLEKIAATIEQQACLLDLQVEDDHADDMALVFSEFCPEGTVVPLSWVAQLERNATEPITVVRVSREMADMVMGVL